MVARIRGHGLNAGEQAIMDRIDRGERRGTIAADLGLSLRYVDEASRRYSGSWRANVAFDEMSRRGTIALGRAIRASGGRFD